MVNQKRKMNFSIVLYDMKIDRICWLSLCYIFFGESASGNSVIISKLVQNCKEYDTQRAFFPAINSGEKMLALLISLVRFVFEEFIKLNEVVLQL